MQTRNLIAGQWVDAGDGRTIAVRDPATDEVVAEVSDASQAQIEHAVEGIVRAQASWSRIAPDERAEVLTRISAIMGERREDLARLMVRENGKPIREARGEIDYARSFLDWSAGEGPRLMGEIVPAPSADKRLFVIRQAIGPCCAITPWNFPSAMITRKLGPALACGCTMIVKPSELTPLSALALAEICLEAGLPEGVLSVVVTSDPAMFSETVLGDPRIRKLSFTGSTEVGRRLLGLAARHVCSVSMELGGHAPFLVFDDVDIEQAADAAVSAKFRNGGQSCISPNRFYVQRSVYDAFCEAVRDRIERLRVGPGMDEQSDVGPLIDDAGVDKVLGHISDAVEHGAEILVGGEIADVSGCCSRFVQPTLLGGMTPEMRISREETFGPVMAVQAFDDEDEAIERANATRYGLAGYVMTRDLARAIRVSEALQFGIVGLNDPVPSTARAPFGGFKQSGLGREGGHHVMDAYSEVKFVSARI